MKQSISVERKAVSAGIKALLTLTEKDRTGGAAALNVGRQTFNNKLSNGSFSCEDLVKLGSYTGATLCYELPNGGKVVLSPQEDKQE